MPHLLRIAFLVALALCASLLLVGPLDRNSPEINAALVQEASERKEVRPEVLADLSYWRRHERNQALCRGQTWIEQCCTDGRPDLTCLTHEDIR